MEVNLLIGDIRPSDVERALLTHGLVVLETTRPHAAMIAAQAQARLFPNWPTSTIDDEEEYPDSLNLLAIDVPPDRGWVHYLVYSKVFPHDLERAKELVRQTVSSWPGRDNYAYRVP